MIESNLRVESAKQDHDGKLLMNRSASASLMRKLNRSAILDLVRDHSPIARSQISRRLNMSMPTVMRIIDELQEEDLVRYSGDCEASGGRPRSLLEFNSQGYAVIGVDLGGTKMYGTVADLGGKILDEIYLPSKQGDSTENLNRVCKLIEELIEKPHPEGQKIRGIGVGAPGVTLFEEGVVTWAPSLGWRDLPLKRILSERFELLTVVENDVNLAALGEFGFGAAKGAASLVCLAVGTGIGSGIVIDRKIYRGYHQSAGEIGYLPPGIGYLGKRYDHYGALESIASGTGIEDRARAYFEQTQLLVGNHFSAEKVFEAARQGESWAQKLVSETVDYLSLAIAAVIAIIDPEVVVLGGGVARSADILIEPICKKLEGVVPVMPRIVQSTLSERAAVMGAIMLVLDALTEHVALENPV
jgi:glucokinase-like ROK family protein